MLVVLAILASLVAAASAGPVNVRELFVPTITSPVKGAVWTIGSFQNITWSTKNAPVNITEKGTVVLAQGGEEFTSGLGSFGDPLATGFDLHTGSVQILVPDVPPANNYEIVLFGDSGDISPDITIQA